MQVILGGGRAYMFPRTEKDPEYPDDTGDRKDGKNLVLEWEKNKTVILFLFLLNNLKSGIQKKCITLSGICTF